MSKTVNEEQGWKVSDEKYGTWFISKNSVIQDWKQDHRQAYPGEPVPEPDEQTIQTWFYEQISWIEIAQYGIKLQGPDMLAWERHFMEQMQRNPNSVSHNDPVEHARELDS